MAEVPDSRVGGKTRGKTISSHSLARDAVVAVNGAASPTGREYRSANVPERRPGATYAKRCTEGADREGNGGRRLSGHADDSPRRPPARAASCRAPTSQSSAGAEARIGSLREIMGHDGLQLLIISPRRARSAPTASWPPFDDGRQERSVSPPSDVSPRLADPRKSVQSSPTCSAISVAVSAAARVAIFSGLRC